MSIVEKYNIDMAHEIRKCALEKQLNILIGSGCSAEALPLMSKYGDSDINDRNEKLVKEIIRRSKISMLKNITKYREFEIIDRIIKTQDAYKKFIYSIIDILNLSNSRQVPRTVNIFTTNYDLFIENAVNDLQSHSRFIFNDGASGYFERILNSSNYNQVVAYKGINDNYISEIPSINLIKSHGSVNWEYKDDKVIVSNMVFDKPMVVLPTGYEEQETFINNYFHDMLRKFQIELDKPQSILIIIGFSFQDKHIAKMVKRALQNRELIVYLFVYNNNRDDRNDKDGREIILENLQVKDIPANLKVIVGNDIYSEEYISGTLKSDIKLTLDNLSEILSNPDIRVQIEDEEGNN